MHNAQGNDSQKQQTQIKAKTLALCKTKTIGENACNKHEHIKHTNKYKKR